MSSEDILRANVTRLREQRGWSIQELASRLNVDRSYLSKSESGKRSFKVSEVNRLAEIFGVSTDYLLGRPSNNNNNHPQAMTVKEALGTIMSYDGKEVTDHDRKVMEEMMADYLRNRGMLKEEA